MGTASADSVCDSDAGMIPRAIRHLFRLAGERSAVAATTIRCAFLEILNEEVRDLLHPDTPSKSIAIRERADGAILVSGMREERAATAEDLEAALERGALNRTTGSTRMNAARRARALARLCGSRGGGGGRPEPSARRFRVRLR